MSRDMLIREDPELCSSWTLELCQCPFIDECTTFVDGYVNQPRPDDTQSADREARAL